jgi:hypothetical protein
VHGKIGDDVYVPLEQAEIYAGGIVIINLPEVAALYDLAHLPDRAGINKGVIDKHGQRALFSLIGEFFGLKRCFRHRLFQPQMLARLQNRHAQLEMC